jgi:hypothetical protein
VRPNRLAVDTAAGDSVVKVVIRIPFSFCGAWVQAPPDWNDEARGGVARSVD